MLISPLEHEAENLILRFRNGDEQAFNQLFTTLYSPLCFFASRLIQNNFAAEEICQDVFFTVWKKRESFTEFKSLKAFIYISARNACMNYLDKENRKAKKMKQVAVEEMDQPHIREMIYAEVLNEIRGEIDRLPEQCAKVIKMLYEEDMKPQHVAEQLNITVSTVYNQKLRGISLLKKRLPAASIDLITVFLLFREF
ncbi:RNA polymerase sigma-70 factor (ECF subfamily) [Filimonas zeae]|uniref:DNA-directed RNA polymerase sigma-70 factor n=1 Tax=Filimonas zeae TaxID=1737353 RepID=A0A917J498_9BACT|nr:RNA polymerase sigma-70 factor [Filimonas zeae]MDR6341376.1 RNA polymerase sigma-70 factor (ECF subfamily) [Filimonas zeae]GGH76127.1 DNA-directed RNA polymerase sigma-70 factor [Filimonas zeae]